MSSNNQVAPSFSLSDSFLESFDSIKSKHYQEFDPFFSLSKSQNNGKVKDIPKTDHSHKTSNEMAHYSINGHNSSKESHKSDRSSNRKLSHNESSKHDKHSVSRSVLSDRTDERPYMSWNFVFEDRPDFVKCGPVGFLPANVQESKLIDDVLLCLVGINGDYVYTDAAHIEAGKFHIDDSAQISLKDCVRNIVPMFKYYSLIIQFTEENSAFEAGLVNQALSAAMRDFLLDYYKLVSQLESQHLQKKLTLQRLWFYLQPSLETMEAIAGIVSALNKRKLHGGAVLTELHLKTKALTCSSKAQEICLALTRAASVPYFEMLEKWIYKGIISDPYSEFLVQDGGKPSVSSNLLEEDQTRYKICKDQVPIFLSLAVDKIVATGKYLNSIVMCGKRVLYPDAKSIVYTMRESQYIESIEPAYHFASRKLLDVFIDEADLYGRLKSVKHYFLLDHADFMVQFLDMAGDELKKPVDDIVPNRLESLLELALRTSSVNDDKYKDDLRIGMRNDDINNQILEILNVGEEEQRRGISPTQETLSGCEPFTGLECFVFFYDVNWPLSLIFDKRAFAYYLLMFRLLFRLKHTETSLCRVWSLNKHSKSLSRRQSVHFAGAFALCQRMLHFIQNLYYFFTLEVIEPCWHDLLMRLTQVHDVDELKQCHLGFLVNMITQGMLNNKTLLEPMSALIKLCEEFSTYMQHLLKPSHNISILCESMIGSYVEEQPFADITDLPARLHSFISEIGSFDEKFQTGLQSMVDILNCLSTSHEMTSVTSMLYRLDFNHYYEQTNSSGSGDFQAD